MKNVIGVIFADSHYADLGELTNVRPLAALPINGRYRIIDFGLSCMVNSGMRNVAVVTQNNYHSLMGHLGSGKQWNLARKRYGLILFPPFSNLSSTGSDSRMDILYGILNYLKRSTQEYVLLSEPNIVINRRFNDVFEAHVDSNADITVVTQKVTGDEDNPEYEAYVYSDEEGNVTGLDRGNNIASAEDKYFGYILINKQTLINIIEQSKVRGKKGYLMNMVYRNIGQLKIKKYRLDGYARKVSTINEYTKVNHQMLKDEVRLALFNEETPIYTKDKDTTPTRYLSNGSVKNCFVADGCVIDGEIENSIIFRSVHIKKGTKIKNSIILQQSDIGENVELENVIVDKKVMIRDNKRLVGTEEFPIVVGKSKVI